MNVLEKIEERRCGKCPAHYGGFNGEDYDDGCNVNADYGHKLCWLAFLPRWIIGILLRREIKRRDKHFEEALAEMERKAAQHDICIHCDKRTDLTAADIDAITKVTMTIAQATTYSSGDIYAVAERIAKVIKDSRVEGEGWRDRQ